MNKIFHMVLIAAVICIGAVGSSHAAITYVDATAVNTTINSSTMVIQNQNASGSYVAYTHYNVSDDDFTGGGTDWQQRDPFGNGGNTFQGGATTDVLNTSVSGLTSGIYHVYAYFWDASTNANPSLDASNWDMAAQLNGGGYINKAASSSGVITASTQTFTVNPLFVEGNRTLYAIDLGTFTGTSFTVDIKGGTDVTGGSFIDFRTWYDGIGYVFVAIPEPGIASLFGMAGLLVLLRRRRHV